MGKRVATLSDVEMQQFGREDENLPAVGETKEEEQEQEDEDLPLLGDRVYERGFVDGRKRERVVLRADSAAVVAEQRMIYDFATSGPRYVLVLFLTATVGMVLHVVYRETMRSRKQAMRRLFEQECGRGSRKTIEKTIATIVFFDYSTMFWGNGRCDPKVIILDGFRESTRIHYKNCTVKADWDAKIVDIYAWLRDDWSYAPYFYLFLNILSTYVVLRLVAHFGSSSHRYAALTVRRRNMGSNELEHCLFLLPLRKSMLEDFPLKLANAKSLRRGCPGSHTTRALWVFAS